MVLSVFVCVCACVCPRVRRADVCVDAHRETQAPPHAAPSLLSHPLPLLIHHPLSEILTSYLKLRGTPLPILLIPFQLDFFPPVALTLRSTRMSLASWVLSRPALAGWQLHRSRACLLWSHRSRCSTCICRMDQASPLVLSPHESTHGSTARRPAAPVAFGDEAWAQPPLQHPPGQERGQQTWECPVRSGVSVGPCVGVFPSGSWGWERGGDRGKNQLVWFRRRNGPSLF